MGKIIKKSVRGEAAKYITRGQALKHLQLSLSDFRRLCILKGIYPREPHNRTKLKAPSSNTIFYYLKDIRFLGHEPLIATFRQLRIFERKIRKYIAKKEWIKMRSLERPQYVLDHIVRERYPSFVDAIRDLDDALSLIALFAILPQTETEGHSAEVAQRCVQVMREFEAYVVRAGALKKTFISIKGIYYQAEILGQPVTWITPHEFSTNVPTKVDFRVMITFLEFYTCLLGFVNFKLFSRLDLSYPLQEDISSITREEPGLFSDLAVFISREVPLKPVSFIIRALGGVVSWGHNEDSSLEESDPSITHQIVDRPSLNNMLMDRVYVQPQWVFDCLNANSILDPSPYMIGQALPPHPSPFTQPDQDLIIENDNAEEEQDQEKEERKQMAVSMMSRKRQRLYSKMQHSRKTKAAHKAKLIEKKKSKQQATTTEQTIINN